MAKPTREYVEWLEENNFSPEDEKLILKTATGMTILWFLLSCIPTAGMFFLPLLINAWTQRKIVKQKSFEPRPGLLYSIFAVAMYISYILIIPWIFAKIAKKFYWGSGLRRLIKKGKVGNGAAACHTEAEKKSESVASQPPAKKKSIAGIVIAVILVLVLLAAIVLFIQPKGGSEAAIPNISIDGRSWTEVEPELIQAGVYYTVTYKDDPSKPINSIIGYTQNMDGTEYAFIVVSSNTTVPHFSGTSEAELTQQAQNADLTLTLQYLDDDGNLHDTNPGGEWMGIESAEPAIGTSVPRGSSVAVTVCVHIEPEISITGQWHNCDNGYSLELSQLTFKEDGTFSFYSMGYIPVNEPTDLYLYDQYWSGARGSTDFTGSYTLEGDQITLTYSLYDFDTDQYFPAGGVYRVTQYDNSLVFSWISGDEDWAFQQHYTAGLFPEGTNYPITSATGTWYLFEEPENPYEGSYFCSFTQLTVYNDGTCDAANPYLERNPYTWAPFSDDYPQYKGTCTFDGSVFDLHYTSTLRIYWETGDYEYVPCDIHIRLTVEMENAIGNVTDAGGTKIVRIGRLKPYPDPGLWSNFDFDPGRILDQYIYQY